MLIASHSDPNHTMNRPQKRKRQERVPSFSECLNEKMGFYGNDDWLAAYSSSETHFVNMWPKTKTADDSYLNRTRKRHRDNRPDEESVHKSTINKLMTAQRKDAQDAHTSQIQAQTPSAPVPLTKQYFNQRPRSSLSPQPSTKQYFNQRPNPQRAQSAQYIAATTNPTHNPSTAAPSDQKTLHSFWKLPQPAKPTFKPAMDQSDEMTDIDSSVPTNCQNNELDMSNLTSEKMSARHFHIAIGQDGSLRNILCPDGEACTVREHHSEGAGGMDVDMNGNGDDEMDMDGEGMDLDDAMVM